MEIIDIIKFIIDMPPAMAVAVSIYLVANMYMSYRGDYKYRALVEALAIEGIDKKTHKLSGDVIERYGLLSRKVQ